MSIAGGALGFPQSWNCEMVKRMGWKPMSTQDGCLNETLLQGPEKSRGLDLTSSTG